MDYGIETKDLPFAPVVERSWIGRVVILAAAVLGAALSAAIFYADASAVTEAVARNAAGYDLLFKSSYTVKSAFSRAVLISRVDIALIFLATLFPYTAASRPLTAGLAFLRSALFALTVPAAISSPLSLISLSVGLIAVFPVLCHADALCVRLKRSRPIRMPIFETYLSLKTAVVCSGALIFVRTVLLLAGSLIYG